MLNWFKKRQTTDPVEVKEKIVGAYQKMAETYNAKIDHKPHNAYYDRPNTLSLLPDVKDKKVLDAACGPGKYAEILMERGADVVGFDISPKMIELAKRRNPTNENFFVHDLEQPFDQLQKGKFDIVICALAMHYVQDWSNTIKEYHRVLRPNGQVIISIEHPFFEYEYFKSKKYFEIEAVKCTWSGFGQRVEVNSYRRPLQDCLTPFTDNGFYIDHLLEPKPVSEFEKLDPKHFRELNNFPAFMCIRAIKG